MKHILVPTDFSPMADRAIEPAADLARRLGARLTLAHVITAPRPPEPVPGAGYYKVALSQWEADQELERNTLAALESRARALRELDVQVSVGRGGAAEGLIALATALGADLIVTSSAGRTGLSRLILGSVAEELTRASPIPVLIWKDAAPAA